MGAVRKAVHDGYPDIRERGWKNTVHRARAALVSGRPRIPRENGFPPRLGTVCGSTHRTRDQALKPERLRCRWRERQEAEHATAVSAAEQMRTISLTGP